MSTKGWAIKVKGEIDVKTVSPTEIAAKINALAIFGVPPTRPWNDEMVDKFFSEIASVAEWQMIQVDISEVK